MLISIRPLFPPSPHVNRLVGGVVASEVYLVQAGVDEAACVHRDRAFSGLAFLHLDS